MAHNPEQPKSILRGGSHDSQNPHDLGPIRPRSSSVGHRPKTGRHKYDPKDIPTASQTKDDSQLYSPYSTRAADDIASTPKKKSPWHWIQKNVLHKGDKKKLAGATSTAKDPSGAAGTGVPRIGQPMKAPPPAQSPRKTPSPTEQNMKGPPHTTTEVLSPPKDSIPIQPQVSAKEPDAWVASVPIRPRSFSLGNHPKSGRHKYDPKDIITTPKDESSANNKTDARSDNRSVNKMDNREDNRSEQPSATAPDSRQTAPLDSRSGQSATTPLSSLSRSAEELGPPARPSDARTAPRPTTPLRSLTALPDAARPLVANHYRLPARTSNSVVNGVPVTKVEFGTRTPGRAQRTLVLVGKTGAGKTTMVDACANYMCQPPKQPQPHHHDHHHHDNQHRDGPVYHITDACTVPDGDLNSGKTTCVTHYVLHPLEGSPVDFTLNLIDTPGVGQGGVEDDSKLLRNIQEIINHHGHQLDAICIVVQASLVRLSEAEKYAYKSLLGVLDDEQKAMIEVIYTYHSGEDPVTARSALTELGVKVKNEYPLNNMVMGLHTDHTNPIYRMCRELADESISRMMGIFTAPVVMRKKELQEKRKPKQSNKRSRPNLPNYENVECSEVKKTEPDQSEKPQLDNDVPQKRSTTYPPGVEQPQFIYETIESQSTRQLPDVPPSPTPRDSCVYQDIDDITRSIILDDETDLDIGQQNESKVLIPRVKMFKQTTADSPDDSDIYDDTITNVEAEFTPADKVSQPESLTQGPYRTILNVDHADGGARIDTEKKAKDQLYTAPQKTPHTAPLKTANSPPKKTQTDSDGWTHSDLEKKAKDQPHTPPQKTHHTPSQKTPHTPTQKTPHTPSQKTPHTPTQKTRTDSDEVPDAKGHVIDDGKLSVCRKGLVGDILKNRKMPKAYMAQLGYSYTAGGAKKDDQIKPVPASPQKFTPHPKLVSLSPKSVAASPTNTSSNTKPVPLSPKPSVDVSVGSKTVSPSVATGKGSPKQVIQASDKTDKDGEMAFKPGSVGKLTEGRKNLLAANIKKRLASDTEDPGLVHIPSPDY